MSQAIDRIRENLTEVVSVSVTGIWLGALFTGQDWWLPFMLIGYIIIVPMTALVFGDREEIAEWWEDEDVTIPEDTNETDPVETLKNRYAAGEISDAEFERKLERLLEIEESESTTAEYDDIDRELDRL
ncbi:SHOCT domain-containing protein [Halodesulfurarchaeum sp.]|uniref:SHOCT domain-containing protein n=1 Tax=Halodesulfurarchaeum sp. TaxID=1980530 RepID=UPI001BBD6B02|nr:SHOCT domain-containing protein [Halodesulfurarchaeum sp.]